MKDLINRTIRMMGVEGVTTTDIHDALVGEGLSEYDAWLTYKAAELVVKGEANAPSAIHDAPTRT